MSTNTKPKSTLRRRFNRVGGFLILATGMVGGTLEIYNQASGAETGLLGIHPVLTIAASAALFYYGNKIDQNNLSENSPDL